MPSKDVSPVLGSTSARMCLGACVLANGCSGASVCAGCEGSAGTGVGAGCCGVGTGSGLGVGGCGVGTGVGVGVGTGVGVGVGTGVGAGVGTGVGTGVGVGSGLGVGTGSGLGVGGCGVFFFVPLRTTLLVGCTSCVSVLAALVVKPFALSTSYVVMTVLEPFLPSVLVSSTPSSSVLSSS